MYVIALTHFLDTKGGIAPERRPARKMADFLTAVVAHASDFDRPGDTSKSLFRSMKREGTRTGDFVADRIRLKEGHVRGADPAPGRLL